MFCEGIHIYTHLGETQAKGLSALEQSVQVGTLQLDGPSQMESLIILNHYSHPK